MVKDEKSAGEVDKKGSLVPLVSLLSVHACYRSPFTGGPDTLQLVLLCNTLLANFTAAIAE